MHVMYKRYDNIPTRTFLTGASNAIGLNRDFRPLSRYLSEMIQDTAIVTTESD